MREPRLAVGELVPHFTVSTPDGQTVRYSAIWQVSNLVLVVLPRADASAERTIEQLRGIETSDTRCVVTFEPLPGLAAPAALVADKWGEIVYLVQAPEDLPTVDDLSEWVDHVRQRCPECEGEAR